MASWIPAALDVVLNRWDSRSGFIVTLVILVFSLLVTFAGIDITKVQPIEWLVIALSCLALSILWWRTRRPRAPKNKIGFGVAITFERSDHAQQLRSDFILALRDLLVESQLSQSFHFIELPASTARSIVNSEDAERLAHSCNLHFLLHGRARRRTYPEGPAHVIHLSGVVRHPPMQYGESQQLGADFRTALPRSLIVGSDGDVLPCEFAASHIDAVSRYVIGTAAILSKDFTFAEELLRDAESKLQHLVSAGAGAPAPAVLLDRVLGRIRNLYEVWLAVSNARYVRSRDAAALREIDAICTKFRIYAPDHHYQLHVSAALVAFLLRHDVEAARGELQACRNSTDATWLYSDAFLHAYDGDLQNAYKSYSKAFRSSLRDPTVPIQCEEFIQNIIDKEPHRKWLYFCIGLINYKAKGDLEAALRDFKRFVDSVDPTRFPRHIKVASRWIEEITEQS